VVGGPTIGPVIGAVCVVSPSLGWRWTEYIEAIWVATILIFALITMPELYPPVLLKHKAARLRKETGDNRYWHPHESQRINLNNIVTKYLSRPLRMLLTEPVCKLMGNRVTRTTWLLRGDSHGSS
jgi:MFS family permease